MILINCLQNFIIDYKDCFWKSILPNDRQNWSHDLKCSFFKITFLSDPSLLLWGPHMELLNFEFYKLLIQMHFIRKITWNDIILCKIKFVINKIYSNQ